MASTGPRFSKRGDSVELDVDGVVNQQLQRGRAFPSAEMRQLPSLRKRPQSSFNGAALFQARR